MASLNNFDASTVDPSVALDPIPAGKYIAVITDSEIPTGGGKTPVIATICRDAVGPWNGRVVILAHVKELLEQAADKLRQIAPDVPVGIYSAGLKRKDLGYAVTIAGIQSIYQRACDLGPVDLLIVDEAHLIPPDGEGMYRQFIADAKVVNPHARVIGLTATPYRMKSGSICGPSRRTGHRAPPAPDGRR
jgi:DNA repair protein RadD